MHSIASPPKDSPCTRWRDFRIRYSSAVELSEFSQGHTRRASIVYNLRMQRSTWLALTLLAGLLNAGISPVALAVGTQDEAARWQRESQAVTIVKKGSTLYYAYGPNLRKLDVNRIRIPFKRGDNLASRDFTVYRSHHGPIVRTQDGRWIAVKLLEDPVRALMQSYLRTKTRDYASFRAIQDMRTDTSNNTVYADADGTIAYFHGNFIPRRDPRFDFSHPVDGSNPDTEWQGPHALADTITLLNPRNG